jgi:DNA-binding response OmpR family regulator
MSTERYNFDETFFLVMDPSRWAAQLTAGILSGFGARDPFILHQPDQAEVMLASGTADGAIITLGAEVEPTLKLIRSVRSRAQGMARFIPIIAVTGRTDPKHVTLARDAGANFVVRRPLSPEVLFERLVWITRAPRDFVDAISYCGPDRRFRDLGPPNGQERRRRKPTRDVIVEI